MRDFFIDWAEKLITVFVALMALAVLVGSIGVMAKTGFFQGLMMLVLGIVYVLIMGGMMYLFFGIFRNTQRTNVLLEELLRK